MSALCNWETCLPVGKRRHDAALQNSSRQFAQFADKLCAVSFPFRKSSLLRHFADGLGRCCSSTQRTEL